MPGDVGGVPNQFHHLIDIVPTILDVTGIKAPELVDGIKQKPIEGISMTYTFDKANADAPSTRKTQYFEMVANRGIYHEGWFANTTPPHGPWVLNAPLPPPEEYKWELYDLTKDFSQAHDLAAQMPEKLKEIQARWDVEAEKYQELPLDNRAFARAVEPRPGATAGRTKFTYTGVNPGIPMSNAPNTIGRSYKITAEVEVPEGGGEGVIVANGGRFGGWGHYIMDGKPVFNFNMLFLKQYQWVGQEAVTPGKHTIVYDFTYDGLGIGKGGSGELMVDGKIVATGKQNNSIAFVEVFDETFDVGVDLRTGVNDKDYQIPFDFTGTIDKLTINLGSTQMGG